MKRLDSYVLRRYIGPLVLTFCIAMFILLMQFLWKYIDELVGKGLHWTIVLQFLSYASAGLVPMALPLAVLLSSIMTFGTMGENMELTAIKSSGVSLQRIMMPLIVISTLISAGGFFFSNNVLPYTNLKTGALLFDIRHKHPELSLSENSFNNDIEGYTIKIGKKNKKTGMLYNMMLYDHTKYNGCTNVTISDSAEMQLTKDTMYMVLTMYSGYSFEDMEEFQAKQRKAVRPHRRSRFEKQRVIIDMSSFKFTRTSDGLFKNNFQMLNLRQLQHAIDSLNAAFAVKKKNFSNSILITSYFKAKIDTGKTDSLLDTKVYVDLDSLYKSISENDKKSVLELATNYARSAQSYVEATKDDFYDSQKWIKRHEIEWHRKFTLSFACFIFFFIGAPLGAIIRKGGLGIPVVVSIFFFIVYYIVSITGEKMVREDLLEAWQGMWISSTILLPLGIFLTYKSTRDAAFMNRESYTKFFQKLFGKKTKKTKTESQDWK